MSEAEFDEANRLILRDAQLSYREGLETLELNFYNHETPWALKNVRKVIEGCKRLNKFSMRNCRRS
ncbi:hypothetical protein BGX30_014169 [Mortierella sp. GBA39]|nr:hypothetical protein BGX30_014169 [Mortierella sp. GBA39]